MEPDRQFEIQLGHMCNNRCVFCVSGQRTADGEAGPTSAEPVVERLRLARRAGHTKVTLLGGEPTLQPHFMSIVRETRELGFEEVVIFTNGVKTARMAFVESVIATGAPVSWRISIQGATRESHERTTRKPGSFGRILRTLENLSQRGQRISVNMCVVTSNYTDLDAFADLLAPFGVHQLHLDLMRPADAGRRSREELRDAMPELGQLVPPMRAMIAALPEHFDVNLGNLPYCVADDLLPWIHHDGNTTETISIDGRDQLSDGWDKYAVKRRDKFHPPSCESCVMRTRCSGVFRLYADFFGTDALVPIDAERLRELDPSGRWVGVWLSDLLERSGYGDVRRLGDSRFELRIGDLQLLFCSTAEGAIARYERFSVHHVRGAAPPDAVAALTERLARCDEPVHPLGLDLIEPLSPTLRAALSRLRSHAPFDGLVWRSVDVQDGRVELELTGAAGGAAQLWFEAPHGRPAVGYRVTAGDGTDLVGGLRQALLALRGA